MGKHGRHATTSGTIRTRPLPVKDTVRLRRPGDIWHKHAFSAFVAIAVPDFLLLALGRLDLVMYTSAGAMCALYAHGLPYAARARAVAWVVAGMVGSLALGLVAAAYVQSTAVLVLLASLVAAVHKMVCDATRIGPPGNVVLTFIAASAFFVPQQPGQVPCHVLLALAGGVLAWLVCMAPALVRPQGPERIATARALEAAAGLLRSVPDAGHSTGHSAGGSARHSVGGSARHSAASAVNARLAHPLPGARPYARQGSRARRPRTAPRPRRVRPRRHRAGLRAPDAGGTRGRGRAVHGLGPGAAPRTPAPRRRPHRGRAGRTRGRRSRARRHRRGRRHRC